MSTTARKCVKCGRLLASNLKKTMRCCGREYVVARGSKQRSAHQSPEKAQWLAEVRSKCNATCEHWRGGESCSAGCELSPTKPCDTFAHILRGKGCFSADPKFPSFDEYLKTNRAARYENGERLFVPTNADHRFRGKIAIVVPNNKSWLGPSRGLLFANTLRSAGYYAKLIPVPASRQIEIERLSGFDLVCVHAMQIDPTLVRQAAKRFPQTNFAIINHSATAHLERLGDRYVEIFSEALSLSRKMKNVWYASQEPVGDKIKRFAGYERALWMPSPCTVIHPRAIREANKPINVVIAGRLDSIKNNLNHIIACKFSRQRLRLILCMERSRALAAVIGELGIDHQWRGTLPHDQWLHFLQTEADIVLCCSLAESFNFVAAEAMSSGVPVVASDAIRFADPRLLVNNTDPEDIAEAIDDIIGDYRSFCVKAVELGSTVFMKQNQEYVRVISSLI